MSVHEHNVKLNTAKEHAHTHTHAHTDKNYRFAKIQFDECRSRWWVRPEH